MTKEEAEQLIEQAKKFIGTEKPVVTKSQLGFPSTIEQCIIDNVFIKEERGSFFPMAHMRSIDRGTLCATEDLSETLEYLRRAKT